MFKKRDRRQVRRFIKSRIRKKIAGTAERPRICVFRSEKHIYAQAVDDLNGRTIAAASTLEKDIRGGGAAGSNMEAAKRVGTMIADRLLAAGLSKIVFDRTGYIYHGRVKALAEAAREKGLKF